MAKERKRKENDPTEARWPATIAILVVGGVFSALPGNLAIGPKWFAFGTIVALLIPVFITHWMRKKKWNHRLGHLLAAVMTGFLLWALTLLILALPSRKEPPVALLQSAASLWISNLLVFALWYWRLDAGGPHERDARPGHREGAFLFPQMMLAEEREQSPEKGWSPIFIDYLFLAFNTSTAFSPTDTPVLSRWAKVLTMIQASISLACIAILAARAINTL